VARWMTWGIGGGLWLVAAYGTLRLNELPEWYVHRLCGPWGCLPSIWSLIAMHGFWALGCLPAGALIAQRFDARRLRRIGTSVAGVGLLLLVLVLGGAALQWMTSRPPDAWRYVPQYSLMSLATQVDVPAVQLLVTGLVLRLVGLRRLKRLEPVPTQATTERVAGEAV